jgi:DNA-directed RNA polymerase subunit RPC12/RpoP
MTIRFRCANTDCASLLQLPDASAGKRARCPRCGLVQSVPAAAPEGAVVVAPRPREEAVLEVVPIEDELHCPYCEERVGPAERKCPACRKSLELVVVGAALSELKRRRSLYGGLAVASVLPSILLLIVGALLWNRLPLFGVPLYVVGLLLFCVSLGFAVFRKRFNPCWLFLGLLFFAGFFVLALVADEKAKRAARLRRFLDHHPAARTD